MIPPVDPPDITPLFLKDFHVFFRAKTHFHTQRLGDNRTFALYYCQEEDLNEYQFNHNSEAMLVSTNVKQMKIMTRTAVALWKMVYAPLFRRGARQILRGRLLDMQAPEKGRWLDSDVKAYLSHVWKRTETLMPIAQLDELPDFGNRHNVFLAAATTAAFQVMLERGVPSKYAQTLVADLGWKIYRWILITGCLPFRMITRNPSRRMRMGVQAMMRLMFSAPGPPGYEVKTWTQGSDTFAHWTHCPPQAFVRRVIEQNGDRGELDAFYHSWCLYDWVGADLLANDGRRGHYSRQHTLSRGDSVCDMCWHGNAKAGQE